MKYVDEFRQRDLALKLAEGIRTAAKPDRIYRLMEFCGGHTHAIFRYGVPDLMPDNVRFVHGPGCPVCVLPIGRIDMAVEIAQRHGAILCSYGDMMRVPGGNRISLQRARADGADIRMVHSTQEALKIAQENPTRDVVMFAIGFETTTPPTAVAIKQADAMGLKNFSAFCNHVLTPAAIQAILDAPDIEQDAVAIDGFLGPAHVSSVIGSQPYVALTEKYRRPVVIAGFEPLDVMQSALMLIEQLNAGRFTVENQYTRVVTPEGNRKAQALVAEVMEMRGEFEWRGLGVIPNSALKIRERYAAFDAERRFDLTPSTAQDIKGCACPEILRGRKRPTDCKLFGTVCTPENPMGSCMVSSEGACAAYWSYGRHRSGSSQTTQESAA
ncbi:hydrogenase formation protein HypD [Magnetofaba australis]|uniref:Hydrogenase maturation factor n=1 Tax=Magnetofaba australis IT-1 TaxID=1434232 RepID=A0A1Y2K9K7_9PROT|nr:hydrogenase formation protein HypD [Magnetofaba australis]OSM07303.1 putative hydrogenase expression/formation protein HypD [Magnetofaba australis IT-1]